MRLKSLVFALSLLPIFSSTSVFATPASNVVSIATSGSKALEYWTPERMKNAKEMTLPRVNRDKVVITPLADMLQQQQTASWGGGDDGEDGNPPTYEMLPNNKPLYKPLAEQNLSGDSRTPTDRGTLNEHFTSSRLVPLTADQTYPYRAAGKLFFTIPGAGNYVCSASVIKPRVVLTAGHCVHAGSGGAAGFFTNFLFVPAFRDGAAPFQSWSASYVNTTPTWASGNGAVPNAADYGMIEMQDKVIGGVNRRIGEITGELGYQLNSLIPNHVTMLGYPCNLDSCQKMHQNMAESFVAVAPNNVEYGSDMGGGASGGPWVQNFGVASTGQTGGLNPGRNRVVGVTSYGYTSTAPKALGASIFDARFTTLLNDLCAHKAGNC